MSETFDYPAYLAAKRIVDEEARNLRIWSKFLETLTELTRRREPSISILEIGSGIGATFERLLEDQQWPEGTRVEYVFLDEHAENQSVCRRKVEGLLAERQASDLHSGPDHMEGYLYNTLWHVRWETAEARAWLKDSARAYHAIIAQSVLDLMNLTETMPLACASLARPGCLYIPLTYDGLTYYLPDGDTTVGSQLMAFYDRTMDERPAAGGSRTGRRVLDWLTRHVAGDIAAGSSDWVVVPGRYDPSGPKARLLDWMLGFLDAEMARCPDEALKRAYPSWRSDRERQLRSGELGLVVRHLDVFARVGPEE